MSSHRREFSLSPSLDIDMVASVILLEITLQQIFPSTQCDSDRTRSHSNMGQSTQSFTVLLNFDMLLSEGLQYHQVGDNCTDVYPRFFSFIS